MIDLDNILECPQCGRSRREQDDSCACGSDYGDSMNVNWGTYEVPLAELDELPTLAEGQADNLKLESDTERVWLSRCTVEDGEPWNNKVTVERLIAGSWIDVEHWEAR